MVLTGILWNRLCAVMFVQSIELKMRLILEMWITKLQACRNAF